MRGTHRRPGRSRPVSCEPLEARLVFSGEYQPLPTGPWGYTPAPATLYTAKSQLTSSGSRLLLPQVSQATLQSRVASPAYADLVFKLEDRGTWFKNRWNPSTLALPDVTTDDPWRRFARELKNTLTLYVSATDATKKATYKATLTGWTNRMATWFGTPTTGAPGAGVPTGDLAQSELASFHALAYDWLKNDTGLTTTERTNIRNNLIVLTRALT